METQLPWMQAFEAAILEFDAARLPEKVTHAKHAILDRIEELHGVNADSERYELRTALQALADLTSAGGRERLRIAIGHES
jgi:hypothetical protein